MSFVLGDKGDAPALLRTLGGEVLSRPPIWLMRQAGRYLPEYREVRSSVGGFMQLCFAPKLAAEVTLQPIRRFGFDAAILFSDILVIPHAFGLDVSFVEGEGPRVAGLFDGDGAMRVGRFELNRLDPVLETLDRVRGALGRDTALIGFCGAPFTVASYMVAGRSSPDQAPVRLFAYREPERFADLIAQLVEASVEYLLAQVGAGAQVVQIFDSWAGVLPEAEFRAWSVEPLADMVRRFRERAPGVPIIVFPREAGSKLSVAVESLPEGVAVGLGTSERLPAAFAALGSARPSQGNLDPLALIAGGRALEEGVRRILRESAKRPHVFNLGHGILPQTPIPHVERLVRLVRAG